MGLLYSQNNTQATDYAFIQATLAQTTGISIGSPILFTSPSIMGTIPFNTVTGEFTLPANKTFILEYLGCQCTGANSIIAQWRNMTTNTLIGNGNYGGYLNASGGEAYAIITTGNLPIIVKLELRYVSTVTSIGVSDINGNRFPAAKITQISGYAPSIGQTVEYGRGTLLVDTFIGVNAIIPFTNSEGSIPLSAGTFTLHAGKTYLLEAYVGYFDTASGTITFQWRNVNTNILIGNPAASLAVSGTANVSGVCIATAIITPTATTQVRVENTGIAHQATGTLANGRSYANITQLGTSAAIAPPASASKIATDNSGNFIKNAVTIAGARGTIATLDNIQCQIPISGNASMQLALVNGTANIRGSHSSISTGVSSSQNIVINLTTAFSYVIAALNLLSQGDITIFTFIDGATLKAYKITLIIDTSYANNIITIERL
jgi:hypothetical protein